MHLVATDVNLMEVRGPISNEFTVTRLYMLIEKTVDIIREMQLNFSYGSLVTNTGQQELQKASFCIYLSWVLAPEEQNPGAR